MAKPLLFIHPPVETCSLDSNWWAFGLRGLLSLLFGVVAWLVPATPVLALTVLFGAFCLVDGTCHLVAGLRRTRKGLRWGGLVLSGGLGVGVGLTMLVLPLLTSIGLAFFLWTMVSSWAVGTGLSQLLAAFRLRREIRGERLLALTALFTTALGLGMFLLLCTRPLASLPALGMAIGVYALVSGFMLLRLALRLFQRSRAPALRVQAQHR